MRFIKFAVLAALIALPVSSASAGVWAYSNTEVSNFTIQYSVDGIVPFAAATPAQVTITGGGPSGLNVAQIGGAAPTIIAGGLDTAQAYQTTNAFGAPAQNTFGQTTPGAGAFSRGDMLFGGNALAGPGTGFSSTVAEMQAQASGDFGQGKGSVSAGNTFFLNVGQAGFYRVKYDGAIELDVSAVAPPSALSATASSSYRIGLNAGAQGSIDDLNAVLSQGISASGGVDSLSASFTDYVTPSVKLLATTPYELNITQLSEVALNQVPEPGTGLIFIGIGLMGLARRRQVI